MQRICLPDKSVPFEPVGYNQSNSRLSIPPEGGLSSYIDSDLAATADIDAETQFFPHNSLAQDELGFEGWHLPYFLQCVGRTRGPSRPSA